MQIVYSEDTDTLLIMLRPEAVASGEDRTETRRVELGQGVNLEVAEDGTVYALEIDGGASQKAELDSIRLVTCASDGTSEQTVHLSERSPE